VSIAPDLDDEGSEDIRAFFEDNLECAARTRVAFFVLPRGA
jgi:hypothetical protein